MSYYPYGICDLGKTHLSWLYSITQKISIQQIPTKNREVLCQALQDNKHESATIPSATVLGSHDQETDQYTHQLAPPACGEWYGTAIEHPGALAQEHYQAANTCVTSCCRAVR